MNQIKSLFGQKTNLTSWFHKRTLVDRVAKVRLVWDKEKEDEDDRARGNRLTRKACPTFSINLLSA